MMMKHVIAAVSALAFSSLAKADALDDFVTQYVGSFDTSAQAALDKTYDTAIWHRAEIWKGKDASARWIYTESWIKGSEKPYRQRISKYELAKDGSITTSSYRMPNEAKLVGAWENTALFDVISPADLTGGQTCHTDIVRTGAASWEGSTRAQQCKNNYKNAAYMISKSSITRDGFVNWDRGFDAGGSLVWGPAKGGYVFKRMDKQVCTAPVYMLVHGDIFDRKKFGAYVGALAKSGLYPKFGGYYTALTPAAEVFEGDVPNTRGMVLAKFPCIENAKAFWNSPEYRAIVPLRDGAATFEVSVFREFPKPEYVTW